MAQKKIKIATSQEILHELTKIALGIREFEVREKTNGENISVPPSEGAVMKALELLGKSSQLFSEKQNLQEELEVKVNVIHPNTQA